VKPVDCPNSPPAVRAERSERWALPATVRSPRTRDERSVVVANSGRVQFGIPSKGKTPKVSTSGRVCQSDGCTTVLSIYNQATDCSVHERRTLSRARARP
jgi:hypothetical protein